MKYFLSAIFISIATIASSQEQLGLRLENYAGSSSLSINPTGNLTNPLTWDLTIVGAGLFFDNNYFFVKETNTFDLLRNASGSTFYLASDAPTTLPSNSYITDYFNDNKKRFFFMNSFVAGPSFTMKIGENHSAGIFTNLRSTVSAFDLPNEFSYYKYDNRPLFETFEVAPFQGVFMSWTEIGVNYAVKIPTYAGFIGFGANLKYLTGYEAGYVENFRTWEHTKLPDDIISIENSYGRYGLTTSNLSNESFDRTGNGRGFGLDIGFTKVIQEYEDGYLFKLSASILDIGSINFTKNAQAHVAENTGLFQLVNEDFKQFDEISELEDMLRLFSDEALGDSLISQVDNEFKLALPTSLALQIDYSITENVFINGLLIQQIPTKALGPKKESLIAVTPRFEHRWFSASLPVSIFDMKKVQMGLAARLAFLTIGTDKLGSLIGKSDYTGSDFYFAIKLNQIDLGLGLFEGSGRTKYGNNKKVKCYF